MKRQTKMDKISAAGSQSSGSEYKLCDYGFGSRSTAGTQLKFIQLSQVDEEQIVAVIVIGGNVIKNKIIDVGEPLSSETLLKLNMLLNTTLNGMSIEEINLGLIARLKEQAGIHSAGDQ